MAWDSAPRPTSTSTQAAMTTNRWRKHHLAMAGINLPVLTDVTSSIVRDRGPPVVRLAWCLLCTSIVVGPPAGYRVRRCRRSWAARGVDEVHIATVAHRVLRGYRPYEGNTRETGPPSTSRPSENRRGNGCVPSSTPVAVLCWADA